MHVGFDHFVNDVAARVVVVRVFRRGTPLHVHAWPVTQRKPRRTVNRAQPAHQAARAFADRRRHAAVGAVEQPLVERVGAVDPLARRAAHAKACLPAILFDDVVEAFADGLHGLVPADAHPARFLALGVRALHRVVDALRVVTCLQRRLALRAVVARRLRRRLVAFRFDDAAVLDRHPHAAFHLAAATAAGTDALDLGRLDLRNLVLSERGPVACGADGRYGGGCGRQLRERATCHRQLPHESSSLFVCFPKKSGLAIRLAKPDARPLLRLVAPPWRQPPSGAGFPQPDASSMRNHTCAYIMHYMGNRIRQACLGL